jgi:hypothetical protein
LEGNSHPSRLSPQQAVARAVIDTYYLKGGVALELRFARAARTTKDFDLGLVGNRAS